MELSFRELKKRDVINVSDGRSLGNIIDIILDFPSGELTGIVVPGRKNRGLLKFFDKTELVINVDRIIKIGNDVILVDLRCEEGGGRRPRPKPRPEKPCPPQVDNCRPTCEDILDGVKRDVRIDTSDY